MFSSPRRLVPFLTVALLAGFSPAQGETEVEKLKKSNAALKAKLEAQSVRMAALEAEIAKREAKAAKKAAFLKANDRKMAKADAEIFIGRPIRFVAKKPQLVVLRGGRLMLSEPRQPNPLLKGDYKKNLDKLGAARKRLEQTEDPTKARKIVDEMNRLLMDVRRALWEVEKAAKGKKPDQGKGRDK